MGSEERFGRRSGRTFEISQLDNNGIVATSAANAMLECIRVVSPEPLIVPVSSNGALFGELGQDRCAVCDANLYRTFETPSQTSTALQPRFAVNEMLQCIRAVSPEPLIVPVSSVGVFLREVGHDRSAWSHRVVLAYRPLGLK